MRWRDSVGWREEGKKIRHEMHMVWMCGPTELRCRNSSPPVIPKLDRLQNLPLDEPSIRLDYPLFLLMLWVFLPSRDTVGHRSVMDELDHEVLLPVLCRPACCTHTPARLHTPASICSRS